MQGSTSDTAFTEIACILPSISDQFSLSMVNGILSAFPMDSYICHLFQSFNPSLENRKAMAFPIPREAPVIKTVLFIKNSFIIHTIL